MYSFLQFFGRNWRTFRPGELAKEPDAVRIGLLGASKAAPMSVIYPAKTHPGVVIAAVAARDESRAQKFAQAHSIPKAYNSYQDLLDDSAIDAVYIGLPNGLHYEWAMKALKSGKHVLLEKPSTSNAAESKALFQYLASSNAKRQTPLVLLEAVHVRFHPAWQKFLTLLDQPNIDEVTAVHILPRGALAADDIRFQYQLSGGCLMDLGYYSVQLVRQAFGSEPIECVRADARVVPSPLEKDTDEALAATWRFPNEGIGHVIADSAATGGYSFTWLTQNWPTYKVPVCTVKHRPKRTRHPDREDLEEVVITTVKFWLALFASVWHRFDVVEEHSLQRVKDGHVEKRWTETNYLKEYQGEIGEDSWTTYRHQLEQFVHAVRGRKGSGIWIDGEDSIRQMEMIDQAYLKAGLPLRPSKGLES